jgi:hypothetical protein
MVCYPPAETRSTSKWSRVNARTLTVSVLPRLTLLTPTKVETVHVNC